MNFKSKYTQELPSFQMTPMIDIVFLMLCFFITTQVFSQWETEIDVKLPTAKTGELPGRLPGEIIINVMRDGAIVVNRQQLGESGLSALLERIVKMFPGQSVLIRADKEVPYKHIIGVIDECRKADLWNISFATGVPESVKDGKTE
jgi:biopolymer transport protein ExbD